MPNGAPRNGNGNGNGQRVLSHYEIYDRHHPEKITVGKAKTLQGALRSIDKRDNAYGGYRYGRRAVYK